MNMFKNWMSKLNGDDASHDGKSQSGEAGAAAESTSLADLLRAIDDYSGHSRQKAVERAGKLADPTLLPMVAGRLNDWVPQVRDAARTAILAMLPRMPSSAIVGILPSINELRNKGRSNHADWLERFANEMLRHVQADDLLVHVKGRDAKLARACFDLLRRHALADQAVVFHLALSSRSDIVLAVRAAEMVRRLPQQEQAVLYSAAMKSHFGPVRTIAIYGLLAQSAADGKRELAQTFLFDPQSSVRSAAIGFLVSEQVDVKAHYRLALESPAAPAAQLRVALIALAGLRDAADLPLVRRFVSHQLASVRLAALNAWLRMAESDKDMIARTALADHAVSVRKAALDMVRRQHAFIPFDAVLDDLLARREWILLLQFAEFGQWDRLEAICKIAFETQNNDDPIRPLLTHLLHGWTQCNSCYTRPTAAQAQLLSSDRARHAFEALTDPSVHFNDILQRELALVMEKQKR